MNKKLQDYTMVGSIHTVSIKTPGIIAVPKAYKDILLCRSRVIDDKPETTCKINLDKISDNIYSYKEFQKIWEILLDSAGIEEYKIIRADFRLDTSDPWHYQKFAKLNRYLISMLAVTYHVYNAYKTDNLFTSKQLSVAIKNRYIECENYDKEAESKGHDVALSRFEIRSKDFPCSDFKKEFVEHWGKRWDKAIRHISEVHQRYNTALIQQYNSGKKTFPVKFRSLTDFLIQYQNCIFSKNQFIQLLSHFPEVENPTTRAKSYKKKYGTDFYTPDDIQSAVSEIKRAIAFYFDN